ncbi:MAG: hypothetical protein ACOC9Z_02175 [Chloroflexota bacterium]
MSNEIFPKIWDWYPEKTNPFSSLWWFFLLLPENEDGGFGPKQIMYVLVSCAGEPVRVNGMENGGLPLKSANGSGPADHEQPIDAFALGWLYDGQRMYDKLVDETVVADLTRGRSLRAWNEEGFGGEIVPGSGRPFAIDANFKGRQGGGQFQVWGDPASEVSSPSVSPVDTPLGGADTLAWRHIQFEGEFSSPSGTEALSGIGYFQRICLNILPFPWKWVWAAFADGSIFSCFIPYVGPHLLRRGDKLFPRWLENLNMQILPSAYYCRAGSLETTTFKTVRMGVSPQNGSYAHFTVYCEAQNGDFMSFRLLPYAHNQVILERRKLSPVWLSLYNYNEYVFRTTDLTGRIGGKPLDVRAMNPGYGNLEYTWGVGL